VGLGTKFMNTKFGGRDRPHLEIYSWVCLPGSEPPPAALPTPPKPTTAPTAVPPVTLETVTLDPVKPVSIGEAMNDEIGF
jgi:hypothetical protein